MNISAPTLAAPTDITTCIGEGIEITGELKFTDAIRVETRISGKIISDLGNLVVGERSHIQATIEVGSIEVLGTVEGTIVAKYKVQIRAGGRVTGEIFTPDLNIEQGAYFEGKCRVAVWVSDAE
jgi:cytoskeletal protein CcmA (bactofilin family)